MSRSSSSSSDEQQPQRLLDDGQLPDDIASMLRSADYDDPPNAEEKKRRILAGAAAFATLGSVAEPHVRNAATSTFLKVVGGLSVMVVVGVAVLFATTRAESPPAPKAAPATTVLLTPTTAFAPSEIEPPGIPSMRVDQLPSVNTPVVAPPPPPPAAPTPTIEDELRAIDNARGALQGRQPAEALANVERYRVTFKEHPRFTVEADAIEIQALAALGRMDEARAKADRFFASNPGSPYTQRVRTAISGNPSSAQGQ